MILLADENVDKQIIDRLRQDGHEILYVAEMEPGISDDLVLTRANEKNALLLTADKDFGELVYLQNLLIAGGVILLRLEGLISDLKAEIVSKAFRDHSADLPQSFSVISPGMIRIRSKT
jgi:predicted nuclease of predicted toxin-antitoxin system